MKRHTLLMENVTSNIADNVSMNGIIPKVTVMTKKLIDEDDDPTSVNNSRYRNGGVMFVGEEMLNENCPMRLLRSFRGKLFKL